MSRPNPSMSIILTSASAIQTSTSRRARHIRTPELDFVDVFRKLHPDDVQYTYWDFFRNAFERNFGWRIDHILATPVFAEHCSKAEVDMAPRALKGTSDHAIMWAEFE